MGDGQHIWAAADWAMTIRNLFVREEGDRLILGAGLFPRWLKQHEPMSFGPTLTPFGPVTVFVKPHSANAFELTLEATWRKHAPIIEVQVPGQRRVFPGGLTNQYQIELAA